MDKAQEIRDQLEGEGRVWLRNAVLAQELAQIDALLTGRNQPGARVGLSGPLGAVIRQSGFAGRIQSLWPNMRPVRLVSFDKNPAANWSVPWHQDRIIAVDRQAALDGYTNWSQKSGVWHCEPPREVLDKMLFVRVHLDASTAENGAMEIACGSHQAGKVRTADAERVAQGYRAEVTEANIGDVLILKMLTLHRSVPSRAKENRRALRIDFAPDAPRSPLSWVD